MSAKKRRITSLPDQLLRAWLIDNAIPTTVLVDLVLEYCAPIYIMLMYQCDDGPLPFQTYSVTVNKSLNRWSNETSIIFNKLSHPQWPLHVTQHSSTNACIKAFHNQIINDCKEQYQGNNAPESQTDIIQSAKTTNHNCQTLVSTMLYQPTNQHYVPGFIQLKNTFLSHTYNEEQCRFVYRYKHLDIDACNDLVSITPAPPSTPPPPPLDIVLQLDYGFSGGCHDAWTALVIKEPYDIRFVSAKCYYLVALR